MIRKDLYAVKVFSDDGKSGAWCVDKIFDNARMAFAHKRELAIQRRDYPLVEPKVVHPSLLTVKLYCLCGNEIVTLNDCRQHERKHLSRF